MGVLGDTDLSPWGNDKFRLGRERDFGISARDSSLAEPTARSGPRILHAALLPGGLVGAGQQLTSEQESAKAMGLPWVSRAVTPIQHNSKASVVVPLRIASEGSSTLARSVRIVKMRKLFYEWLSLQQDKFDAILMRYNSFDPLLLRFISRASIPILTVHHSIEEHALLAQNDTQSRITAQIEQVVGRRILARGFGVVGVSPQIVRYELSRISGDTSRGYLYPNGILPSNHPPSERRSSVPELLFVASTFEGYHGLDELLASIKDHSGEFRLHVVGDTSMGLRKLYLGERRIIFHGRLQPREIRSLAARCWAGVGPFGFGKIGIYEATPLKVREYLDLGLPVFADYQDIFPDSFPFFTRCEPSISYVIEAVLNHDEVDRQTVRDQSSPYIDKRLILERLYAQLSKDLQRYA